MHITKNHKGAKLVRLQGDKVKLTDVLRLDVRMHKVTFFVKILQAEKDLPGDTLYDARRDTFPAVFLDEGEDICAEGLKGHAYMDCRGDRVGERIEEGDDMGPPGMRGGGICDLS